MVMVVVADMSKPRRTRSLRRSMARNLPEVGSARTITILKELEPMSTVAKSFGFEGFAGIIGGGTGTRLAAIGILAVRINCRKAVGMRESSRLFYENGGFHRRRV